MATCVTPADLATWRTQLAEEGDGLRLRLMAEVEQLQTELAGARREFARKAASALAKRLQDAGIQPGRRPFVPGRRCETVPGEAAAQ